MHLPSAYTYTDSGVKSIHLIFSVYVTCKAPLEPQGTQGRELTEAIVLVAILSVPSSQWTCSPPLAEQQQPANIALTSSAPAECGSERKLNLASALGCLPPRNALDSQLLCVLQTSLPIAGVQRGSMFFMFFFYFLTWLTRSLALASTSPHTD